jgi:hypothetical protein
LLDAKRHASFSSPDTGSESDPPADYPQLIEPSSKEADSDEEDFETPSWPTTPPPGFLDVTSLPDDLLSQVYMIERRALVPLLLSSTWRKKKGKRGVEECLAAIGDMAKNRIAFIPQ